MRKTILFAFCWIILLCTSCGERFARTEKIGIVPQPDKVTEKEGAFELTPRTRIVLLSDDSLLESSARFFAGLTEKSFGRPLRVAYEKEAQKKAINISLNETLEPEAYQINIAPDGIQIDGGSPAGVFYAFQTLRQLLPSPVLNGQQGQSAELPAAEIGDAPRIAYRAVLLDVGRHFFDVNQIKRFIDILALHKINRFQWHLTEDQGWRIEIKKYPELTRTGAFRDRCDLTPPKAGEPAKDPVAYGGFYTQDEIRDIVRYASERFITIVPEIEMPGHAMAALASYPELGCRGEDYTVPSLWGVKEDVYCAGKEETFGFLEDVLAEVMELFPSQYIHIGGDECLKNRWEECPLCQRRIREERLKDEHELQSYFVKRIEKFLNAHGRKMIGWDEIRQGGLSETATVLSRKREQGLADALISGNDVIMTPYLNCYFDYYQSDKTDTEPLAIGGCLPLEKAYELDPYLGLREDQRKYIVGVQANLWTEFIATQEHLEYMTLPRLAAFAEKSWSENQTGYENFRLRAVELTRLYDACGYNYAKHLFSENESPAVE